MDIIWTTSRSNKSFNYWAPDALRWPSSPNRAFTTMNTVNLLPDRRPRLRPCVQMTTLRTSTKFRWRNGFEKIVTLSKNAATTLAINWPEEVSSTAERGQTWKRTKSHVRSRRWIRKTFAPCQGAPSRPCALFIRSFLKKEPEKSP